MTADAKTVTVMVIKYLNSYEFQDGNSNGNFGQRILKKNKTAGKNFDSNCNSPMSGHSYLRALSNGGGGT